MWLRGGAGVLFAIVCAGHLASSESKIIYRKAAPTPASSLEKDIQTVINQIHSLSNPKGQTRSTDPLPVEGVDLNAYYSVISNLYVLLQPLMREGFIEDLPKMLVCVLSGKQDCGLEAELIRAVSVEMGPTVMAAVASLTSPTCPTGFGTDRESYSFFKAYFQMSDSTMATLVGIQEIFVNILTYFPVSGNLVDAVSGLVDTVSKYILEVLFSVLEVPIEYIKIALQFGIRVPTLDNQGKCEHGDLKQLIMWGLRHNVSWSFGTALIDIFLDIFLAPDQSVCAYPSSNCPGVPFQRSALDSKNTIDIYRNILLQCDHQNLAELNDTICPEIVSGLRKTSSVSVLLFCQALSSLNLKQIELVWSNACYVFQAVMSPLTTRSAVNCPNGGTFPAPVVNLPPTFAPNSPLRIVREASNLNQLACNYKSWMDNILVDPVLVSLCGDNQREQFVKNVCNNATVMRKLLSDKTNLWLYAYCGNSTANLGYMVTEHCLYDQWMFQASVIDPYLLEFCMILDKERLSLLICQNIGFFMLLFSSPSNAHLMPNCSQILPRPPPNTDVDEVDPCQYSQWQDLSQIHLNIISLCSQFDAEDFNREVCANQTFLNKLLINKQNNWLQPHCAKAVLEMPSLNQENFNITKWCDYQMWESRYVDDSVVGLCWQQDQLAFRKNVCCNVAVFQRLLQDPRNTWLRTVCNDTEEIDKALLVQQVCKYGEWTRPIIVDMTEVAVCAVVDPSNFISKVCLNGTVLKNLLANQENTWLIQHCSNHTSKGENLGGNEQGIVGFNPTDQCLYLSWSIAFPDPGLITLCWEHDQANFVSVICPNSNLLSALLQEPYSAWVGSVCASAANVTNTGTNEPHLCLAQDLVKKFNWTCSRDLTLACQPGAGPNVMMQMIVRCWLENVRIRMRHLLTPEVTAVLDQAVSMAMVSLLALEEIQNTTYHVTENIRLSILASVEKFFKKETDFVNKRVLLQCFGRVLTSLMQTPRDITPDEFDFFQEYFNIPVDKLRSVLSGSHVTTIRMILLYYSQNKDTLQLPQNYLPTLASVLFQTHLATDGTLFSDLASLLALASPADIQALPLLQNNANVRETINLHLGLMSLEQRNAFGAWLGAAMLPINITRGQQSLIRDTGNLIAYLPFYNFQHLSAAQLLDGLDVLQRNTLSPIKQEFIAERLIGMYKNLTSQDFIRLGSITCRADPEDLIVYKGTEAFPVIQDTIRNCIRDGLNLPSYLLSRLLLNSTQSKDPSVLTREQITETAPLLPMLGVSFIQNLSSSQLLNALPIIKSVTFSPAQASIIVDKLSSVMKMNSPGMLQQLGSLVVGVKSEFLLTLTSEKLLSSLPSMAQQTPSFSPAQCNAIATKLWGFVDVPSWLDEVEPLIFCTPLVSVLHRTGPLVMNLTTSVLKPWNIQQARAIFNKVLELKPSLIKEDFLSLGTTGQGVTCKILLERLRANRSPASVRKILLFLKQQPSLLHTSLKKCVVDEVYQYDFFPEVLSDFGAELALAMPVSTVKKFTVDIMDSLRAVIITEPHHFLLLSRKKQELLVDKIVQRLSMYTGLYTEEEFRSLGIMATFVTDEIFIQLDRNFFMENMNFLQTFCYGTTKMDRVARILQETATFGPVKTWTKATLSQVGRFLFFLPIDKLQEIPQELMSVARIERLFMGQRQWEGGPIGSHCLDVSERRSNFEKQQFVLQFFLGFLKVLSTPQIIPTCEILHSTTPSVWISGSLTSMPSSAFLNCLELMGQDPFLPSYHRIKLLQKVKKMYGPVSTFTQSLISQLARIAVEMTNEELGSLQVSERNTISALGAVDLWTSKQQEILFAAVLNSTKQSVSQLDSSTLVALGHIVCGAKASEMIYFNAVEFSKAVHYLGQLKLKCAEDQLRAMVGLLNHALAFGPTPFWGTHVFIEIGIIAAGLPDIDMSSLVRAQIEGITPLAISVIPPTKFSVVFSHQQISMFSHEQAEAVPPTVIDALSYMQKQALAMVLTPWEDRPVDFRGRSLGLALSHCPMCLLLGLLMLLVVPS